MRSEFPFSKRPTKNFKYESRSSVAFPEVIEEDKAEENQVSLIIFTSFTTTFSFHVVFMRCVSFYLILA